MRPAAAVLAVPMAFALAYGGVSCPTHSRPEEAATHRPPAEAPPAGGKTEAPLGAPDEGQYLPAELSTIGWDRIGNAPIVLVREIEGGKVVPIWVGVAEARAIALALHEVEPPRPMTHDLMVDLLAKLGATLEAVVVRDLVAGTYLGYLKLHVDGEEEPLWVDTRPSDGLALAARTGARVFIARKVLDQTPDYDFLAPDSGDQVVHFAGLTLVAPTPELVREHALPERDGLVVVRAIGEAAAQGLERGDLVVEVAGVTPREPVDFLDAVEAAPAGEPVALTYVRDGEEHTVALTPEVPTLEEQESGPKQIA